MTGQVTSDSIGKIGLSRLPKVFDTIPLLETWLIFQSCNPIFSECEIAPRTALPTPTSGSVCNAHTGSTDESASYADTGGCIYFGKTGGSVDTASGSINALGTNHANAVPTPTRDPWQDSPQKALDP